MSVDEAILLEGAHGRARVHPVGATVLSWEPTGGDDVLWVASAARYEEGAAVRGGVPIVWPWFADAGRPAHGLVRKRRWTLTEQSVVDGIATSEWRIDVDEGDWAFTLTYRVRVGQDLSLELVHQDRSGRPSEVGGALHTYFRLDPSRALVHGLHATGFDKLTTAERPVQGPQSLRGPLDLVVPHAAAVTIEDGPRRIGVHGQGHRDVVLWNPGNADVSDLTPGEQHAFACVETAIVSSAIAVPAGGQATLGVRLRRSE